MAPRLRIVQRLASGGMAEVFLARENCDGVERLVVLKRVLEHLRDEERFLAMFASEARLALQLQHANVVQVIDAGTEGGLPYIKMEWLDGVDVRKLAARAADAGATINPAVACAIVSAAARGLHYAHTRKDANGNALGVVHRDVSPHNVFVTRDGGVKVLDFGVAKSAAQLSVTRTGELRGKPVYMAPEQLMGLEIDARADVFALGVVLWELLAGRRLFQRDDHAAIAHAVINEPAAPPSSVTPGLPAELDEIVLAMLSKFPQTRPATAHEVAASLDRVVHALGCTSPVDAIAAEVARWCPRDEVSRPTLLTAPVRPPAAGAGGEAARAQSDEVGSIAAVQTANERAASPSRPRVGGSALGVRAAGFVLVGAVGAVIALRALGGGERGAPAPDAAPAARVTPGASAVPQGPRAAIAEARPAVAIPRAAEGADDAGTVTAEAPSANRAAGPRSHPAAPARASARRRRGAGTSSGMMGNYDEH
jgi:hypothetical protein